MKLNNEGLKDTAAWLDKGYKLPEFDREAVKAKTMKEPKWIHFGAGNIFRAFQANVVQNLLNQGIIDTGLIVAEGYDYEIVEKMNRPHDDLSILVTLKANGTVEKTVVGSVVESCMLEEENEKELSNSLNSLGKPYMVSTWYNNGIKENETIKKYWLNCNIELVDHKYIIGAKSGNRRNVSEAILYNFNIAETNQDN